MGRFEINGVPLTVIVIVQFLILDYERMCREQHNTQHPAMQNAMRQICKAIEQAYISIPEEYRNGVKFYIKFGYPFLFDDKSHMRWYRHFIRTAAQNLHLIA